ncbi:MAG: trigger factor [Chloroflexi bacterium]|nr:trigger factor [Chloroflexota bacterium]
MNLQTERIENHRAQFTIEIESDQLEDAKRKAARKISRQVRIKGFRKGKAPYGLVVRQVGEGAVLEEALDDLGDVLYKQALDESDVTPYGPGAFEDFQLEPAPTFVFSVPLQPEVDLQDYQDVRLDFEKPIVSESEIDAALKQMRMRNIEVLDEEVEVAGPGHRVTIAVDSEFVDGDPPADEADALAEDALTAESDEADESAAADEEPAPYVPKKGDTFVNDENTQIILDPNEDPFIHGFVGNLIGAERGSDVQFELTIPDDDAEERIIGRRVSFIVTINDIEAISIPELDDEFARRNSRERGDEELDLAGLRQSIHDDLARAAQDNARSQYSAAVLEKIVDGAEIEYPDLMLTEQIDEMIGEFEGNLKQQRLNLDEYLRLTNSTKDGLREQYRESAVYSLRQSLVLRELVRVRDIEISDEALELRLNSVIAGYGTNPEIRKLFDSPQMRGNIRNELVMNHLNAHLAAIGMGEDPSALIEDMESRAAADTERARERRERLQRYLAEDAASGNEEPASGDAIDASAPQAELDAPAADAPSPEDGCAETETGNS